jgi:hypothetical protein
VSAALRQRRTEAARALAADPRRAQVAWDDLAAWPDWATLDAGARDALALRAGAWLHAGALQRCIVGPVLQQVQALLGAPTFERLMAHPEPMRQAASEATAAPAADVLPAPAALAAWLQAQGLEALLASVASPVLRVVLREQHAPHSLPPLPALDSARARRAVAEAQR